MNGSFNALILVDKLAKLNSSQQSIETLSHWCIFHRNNARQVVETWERQFYLAPHDRTVSFLYLANDILQNSKKKGMEFITEFWRVLPRALNDVLKSGDESGRTAVTRLVDIWEERKVFGLRVQNLKEELLGRNMENRNRDVKGISYKLKQPGGELLEKLISSYEHVNNVPVDEDTLFGKCQIAIDFVDKLEREYRNNSYLGNNNGDKVVGELQVQQKSLKDCIEQLKAVELSRANLISYLREALHEQETKSEQVRNQLQVAQSRYKQTEIISKGQLPLDQRPSDSSPIASDAQVTLVSESVDVAGEKSQTASVKHGQNGEGEDPKTTASSTAKAQMLSYVLSSLASGGAIGQGIKEEYPSDNKRPKLDNGAPYVSQLPPQPPLPPFPHPDSLQPPPPQQQPPSPSLVHSSPDMQHLPPLPPNPLPPIPPIPPPSAQLMQTGMPYAYGSAPFPMPNYPMLGMPMYPGAPIPYQSFQGSEGSGLYGQPPFPAAPPPLSRQ